MSIVVTCKCGKTLRVKDKYAGKTGKCPNCGGALAIPDRPFQRPDGHGSSNEKHEKARSPSSSTSPRRSSSPEPIEKVHSGGSPTEALDRKAEGRILLRLQRAHEDVRKAERNLKVSIVRCLVIGYGLSFPAVLDVPAFFRISWVIGAVCATIWLEKRRKRLGTLQVQQAQKALEACALEIQDTAPSWVAEVGGMSALLDSKRFEDELRLWEERADSHQDAGTAVVAADRSAEPVNPGVAGLLKHKSFKWSMVAIAGCILVSLPFGIWFLAGGSSRPATSNSSTPSDSYRACPRCNGSGQETKRCSDCDGGETRCTYVTPKTYQFTLTGTGFNQFVCVGGKLDKEEWGYKRDGVVKGSSRVDGGVCPECNGRGFKRCWQCSGKGEIRVQCTKCEGKGEI